MNIGETPLGEARLASRYAVVGNRSVHNRDLSQANVGSSKLPSPTNIRKVGSYHSIGIFHDPTLEEGQVMVMRKQGLGVQAVFLQTFNPTAMELLDRLFSKYRLYTLSKGLGI